MSETSMDFQSVLEEGKFGMLLLFVLVVGRVKIAVCEADWVLAAV